MSRLGLKFFNWRIGVYPKIFQMRWTNRSRENGGRWGGWLVTFKVFILGFHERVFQWTWVVIPTEFLRLERVRRNIGDQVLGNDEGVVEWSTLEGDGKLWRVCFRIDLEPECVAEELEDLGGVVGVGGGGEPSMRLRRWRILFDCIGNPHRG